MTLSLDDCPYCLKTTSSEKGKQLIPEPGMSNAPEGKAHLREGREHEVQSGPFLELEVIGIWPQQEFGETGLPRAPEQSPPGL